MRHDADIFYNKLKKKGFFMKMIFLWAMFLAIMTSCNSSQKNNAQVENSGIKTESQAQTSNLFGIMREFFLQQIVKA